MNSSQTPGIPDQYLTVKEISGLLRISVATVYRLIENRQMPYLKVGGQVRFRKLSIDAWARQREKAPLAV